MVVCTIGRPARREQPLKTKEAHGADGRTRTGDLLFTKQLLYQLSYVGMCAEARDRPGFAGRRIGPSRTSGVQGSLPSG